MSQSSGKLCNLVLVLLLFCTGRPLFGQNYRGPLPTEQSYSLGQFIVSWQIHDGKPWLEIKHESTGSRVLWQTQPGLAFIAAAQGKETVISNRGSFNFSDKIQQKFTKQSIQSITQDDRGLSIRGQVFATHEAIEYEFLLSPVADQQLQFTLSLGTAGKANRLYLKYESEADEKIFGFGAQYTYFNAKGRVLPIWAQEEGHGRGVWPLTPILNAFGGGSGGNWSTSYTSVPLYMTNHLRSLLLENSEYLIFDMEKPEQIAIEVFARKLQGRILAGNSPLELMEQLTAYTGRMRPLPDWVHAGAIIGTGGGEGRVVEIERKLEAHKVPVTAFFLQDWVGQRSTVFGRRLWWNWEADDQLYPNWPDFIQSMKNRGYRVLSYINPFLADSIDKPNLQRNFYQEALDQKFLVLNSKNKPYEIGVGGFDAAMIDFSQVEAGAWFQQILRDKLIDSGVSGWMADFGEALPYDAKISTNNAANFHGPYLEAFAKAQETAMNQSKLKDDGVFFVRSGNIRSPGIARLFWLGDQLVSWDEFDGIKSTVTALMSSGISGYSLNHSDIGGYLSIKLFGQPILYLRSKELLLRWMELNAFTAVFRTHEGNSAGQQFHSDEDTLDHFSRCGKIFQALFDYRKKLMQEAQEHGYPLVRHPFLFDPTDPKLFDYPYQFMLGGDILVAPVLDPDRQSVQLYLPRGRWIHAWSKQIYGHEEHGTPLEINAPIGQPAFFIREDSGEWPKIRSKLAALGL